MQMRAVSTDRNSDRWSGGPSGRYPSVQPPRAVPQVAAANLQPRLMAGTNVVSLGGEHTSNRFVWQQLARPLRAPSRPRTPAT